ncbi:MAG: mevalonate kinase [Candidatus Thorarchaeota archaeon]|nr:mevalonate kinase [Candidatus Thorarchaeota archaeon]
MSSGSGKGKTILFGEHFVVYGLPALAAGIASETTAKITRVRSFGWKLVDDRPAMPGYKEKKYEEQKVSIDKMLEHLNIDVTKTGFQIDLGGDLVCASGIGASAASCVAIARALSEEYSLGLDDEQINETAYIGEMGYHGTPSGIDNTASTYGGLIWYVRDLSGGTPKFEKLKLGKSANLVIASTGLTASTKVVVGDVAKKKEADPDWFDSVSEKYVQLVNAAREALIGLKFNKVGELMNKNHTLLQELTVSCKELDNLVDIARDNGAIGAKMTGTGRGGNIIALAPDEPTTKKIAEALKKGRAAGVWTTTFGL